MPDGTTAAIFLFLTCAFVYGLGSLLISAYFRRKAQFVDDLHNKLKGKPDGTSE
jgi:hypothetical protein